MFDAKKEKIIYFLEKIPKGSFAQSPKKWFLKNGYNDCIDLLDKNLIQTKVNLYKFAYGEGICKNCKKPHCKLLTLKGWKSWSITCSEKCKRELTSKRQIGENNTCHRMTVETKNNMKNKLSKIMKDKIKNGDFTPKSENYRTFGMIEFRYLNEIRKVRSLWELIYWLKNESLEYEKIRIEYFDSITNKERIYITDFYDSSTNTLFEIKPTKFQDIRYHDKKNAAKKLGYNFITVDETYFNMCKTPDMILKIKEAVINFEKIEKRLKWLKKA